MLKHDIQLAIVLDTHRRPQEGTKDADGTRFPSFQIELQ